MFTSEFKIKNFLTVIILTILASLVFLTSLNIYKNYPPADGKILSNGNLLGGDFFAFYLGGRLFLEHPNKLYDFEFQREYRKKLLGEAEVGIKGDMPFVYPPLVARYAAIFAKLELETAFYFWVLIGFLASLSSLLLLLRVLGLLNLPSLFPIFVGILGFIPYYLNTLMGGQLSWFGMVIFSLMMICLLKKADYLAGAILAFGYYKPPLFLFAAVYLAFKCGRKFIFGGIAMSLVLVLCSVLVIGVEEFLQYLQAVSKYTYGQNLMDNFELPPSAGMGIFALLTSLFPESGVNILIYVILFLALLVFGLNQQKHLRSTSLEYAMIIFASVGLSIQCIKYDLALLLVPFILIIFEFKNLPTKFKFLISLGLGGFYLEFLGREILLNRIILNVSSLLFLYLLTVLVITLHQHRRLQSIN